MSRKSQSPMVEAQPATKTTLPILIPNLEHIDRETTYKQRLNRPFKVIQNLPISNEFPDYSKLTHPMSIKDSAVLHNSLIVSRYNWCHHLFRAYWTRKEQYVDANDNKKRDRMAKLCSGSLECGPHIFDVRFFILKDDERERQFQEEQERKREERQRRKIEREEASLKRQEQLQIKMISGEEKKATSAKEGFNALITGNEKSSNSKNISEESKSGTSLSSSEPNMTPPVKAKNGLTNTSINSTEAESNILSEKNKNTLVESSQSYEKKIDKTEKDESAVTNDLSVNDKSSENSTVQKNDSNGLNNSQTAVSFATSSTYINKESKFAKDETASKITTGKLPISVTSSRANNNQIDPATTKQPFNMSKPVEITKITPAIEVEITPSNATVSLAGSKKNDTTSTSRKVNNKNESKSKKVSERTTKDIMSNPEQAQMINNLNLLAKSDPHLSSLMKHVASGGASVEQISEFQRYIQKAKEMSKAKKDTKASKQQNKIKVNKAITTSTESVLLKHTKSLSKQELQESAKKREEELLKRAADMRKQQEEAKLAKIRLKEEKEKEKLRIKQEKLELREKARAEKEKLKQLAKEQKEKQKLLRRQQREAERERELQDKAERRGVSKTKIKREENEDDDIWNDKLTVFQERYLNNATIIFEFNENSSARFFLPKDAIFEIIKNAEEDSDTSDKLNDDTSIVKNETTEAEQHRKKKSPYVTLLASFVLVHNQGEIDGWERRLAEKKKAEEQKEHEEEKKKRKRKGGGWSVNKRLTRQSRHAKAVEAERNTEENYQEEDDDLEENKYRPIEIYSCVTIKLAHIPFRFADLLKNSGNDLQTSKSNMEQVMKRGTRLPEGWVWNQIDGINDEILGETLRFNLQKLDYVNGGGKLKGKMMAKKIMELGQRSHR